MRSCSRSDRAESGIQKTFSVDHVVTNVQNSQAGAGRNVWHSRANTIHLSQSPPLARICRVIPQDRHRR